MVEKTERAKSRVHLLCLPCLEPGSRLFEQLPLLEEPAQRRAGDPELDGEVGWGADHRLTGTAGTRAGSGLRRPSGRSGGKRAGA